MDKIIEHLKDPAWWFTAVFVAMIVGSTYGTLLT
jgi:hypothetical protein